MTIGFEVNRFSVNQSFTESVLISWNLFLLLEDGINNTHLEKLLESLDKICLKVFNFRYIMSININ